MSFSYVVGDIGGTNARMHLYNVKEGEDETLVYKKTYPSKDFNTLTLIIKKFLEEADVEEMPTSACFSVAGPVKDGRVVYINLDWVHTEEEIEKEFGIRKCIFLNDFAACAYGINLLKDEELVEFTENITPNPKGPKIIIGAGTGLGEAYIFKTPDGKSLVVPGEGGSKDFPAKNKLEFDLMMFIKKYKNLDRVRVERAISGPGIENIYWFLVHNNPSLENADVSKNVIDATHAGHVISTHAINKTDVLCEKTLKMFISLYGSEAGNMALSVLPSGGIYIAGGIAPKIRDVMKEDFLQSFYNKGRLLPMLSKFPIYVITNLNLGILGARYMARSKISEFKPSISHNLSSGDIHKLAKEAKLISQEPKSEVNSFENFVPNSDVNSKKFKMKSSAKYANGTNERKTLTNFLWMGTGIAISVFAMLSFMAGKRSRD